MINIRFGLFLESSLATILINILIFIKMKRLSLRSFNFIKSLIKLKVFGYLVFILVLGCSTVHAQETSPFKWPEGKKVAVSLTFDDGRNSQVDAGTVLFDKYGVKATFFVVPSGVEQRLDKWKKAVAEGHEIGNHSLVHPCSGNFLWARKNALEEYSLEKMENELAEANRQLNQLLGINPATFAYPCGQKFVGRGQQTQSYVPVIAKMFTLGRGWLDEAPNDPQYCDFAQLTGMEMDGKDFDEILPLIEGAKEAGLWLVLAGHDIGETARQTTRLTMLEELIQYAQDPANGVWLAPAGTVAQYVQANRLAFNK
jgi:peptidoglycan-N-acetylglucosamine deacetylase